MKNKHRLLALAACSAITFAVALPANADEPGAYGPGMMRGAAPAQGGYGPGMMGGCGPGPGAYGPGMMRGYGPGQGGYGHGYGYGQGHGRGFAYGGMMGPGMMGGYGGGMMGGFGPGMMGLAGPLHMLDLTDQQRSKINQFRDDLRRRNWTVMGKLIDEQARMRDLLGADKREPSAIGKQAMKIADLRRQMLEASVEANNHIEALLSKEQKEQMQTYRRGWMMSDD